MVMLCGKQSKKIENKKAAVSLHFAHYNFVRQHKALRMPPGVERPEISR